MKSKINKSTNDLLNDKMLLLNPPVNNLNKKLTEKSIASTLEH
jgi:hypothetical protein